MDSWCATSAYENTKEYYSYKYCDADELALGLTIFDYGAGTTVTGEECVPMIYSGASYLKCTSDTGIKLYFQFFDIITFITFKNLSMRQMIQKYSDYSP